MNKKIEVENIQVKETRQNMTYAIYEITRQMAVILTLLVSVYWFANDGYLKAILNIINGWFFTCISRLFQKRVNRITVSYIFVFVVVFLVNGICSCYYTTERISMLHPGGFTAWGKKDYYYLYFLINIVVYTFVGIYLNRIKTRKVIQFTEVKINKNEECNLIIGSYVLAVLSLATGNSDLIIPVMALILGRIVIKKEKRLLNGLVFMAFAMIFKGTLMQRYNFIQIVLPSVFMYLIYSKYNHKKMRVATMYGFLVVGLIAVGLYGTISEVIKLNSLQESYSLVNVLTSFESILYFFERQFYRLFSIWVKLGGYILYHVDNVSSFYWGSTYLKSLAGVFGFDYVSLPVIAAEYNGSIYAQPGLLAEGYANFGVVGAVGNILLVFFFMEYTRKQFYKNPTFSNLLLMVVPFTKILLDGGTLNSAIYIYIVLLVCAICGNKFIKVHSSN